MLLFTSKFAPHTMTFFGQVGKRKIGPEDQYFLKNHSEVIEGLKLLRYIGVLTNKV